MSKVTKASQPPRVVWPAVFGIAGLLVATLWLLHRCSDSNARAASIIALKVRVHRSVAHDVKAFTQGLVWHQGRLYESTGVYRHSELRELDPSDGRALRRAALPDTFFGEGLALVDDRLVQLTWKNEVAWVWNRRDFSKVRELKYKGEGWGLCYDGKSLVMSDGSDRLTWRHPGTFWVQRSVQVTEDGRPLKALNELECVGGDVYANVWQTDRIVRIDARSGRVKAVVDAAALLTPEERRVADVLNGIAYDAKTKRFWITGKLWPKVFQVEFVPAGDPK